MQVYCRENYSVCNKKLCVMMQKLLIPQNIWKYELLFITL